MIKANVNRLREVAKDFFRATFVQVSFYDADANFICAYPDQMSRYCRALQQLPQEKAACCAFIQDSFARCREKGDILYTKCPAGLSGAWIPIYENGILLGFIEFSQLIRKGDGEATKAHLLHLCKTYALDTEEMFEKYRRLQVFEQDRIESLARIIKASTYYLWLNNMIEITAENLPQHITAYIENNLTADLSVPALCSHMHISKSALYRISRAHFKMSISEYVRHLRMEKAKALLKKTSLSIAAVSESVGINDANYFTKLFKAHTGVLPGKFKAYQAKSHSRRSHQ